jgi:membrane protein implicated in regulation of membrane protease activity
MQWEYWIAIGLILVTVEIFTATFFILWFGIAAVLLGLFTWFFPAYPMPAQIMSWASLSLMMAVLWIKVFKDRIPDKRWTAEEVIGEVGMLTAPVAEFQKGKVRFQKPILGSEEWVCISNSDIPLGERVRIVSIEGNVVRVDLA